MLASEAFATANRFEPGAQVAAVINGRQRVLTIVGVALSPEYVYCIPPGELIPDDRRFGIIWMREPVLAAAFNLEGAFNSITLRLMKGHFTPESHFGFEGAAWYWHFVDVVWLGLYFLVYWL